MCLTTNPMKNGPAGVPIVVIKVHQPRLCARCSGSHSSVTKPLPLPIGGEIRKAVSTRVAICAP